MDEQQGRVVAIAELDELRCLLSLLREDHSLLIGDDPDGESVYRRPTGHQRSPVEGLVFVESGAIDDPPQDLAHVERNPEVLRDDSQQILGVVERGVGGQGRPEPELAPIQMSDDFPPETNGVVLILGEVVGETRDTRMHLGSAQLFVGRLLPGRHLDEGGTPRNTLARSLTITE